MFTLNQPILQPVLDQLQAANTIYIVIGSDPTLDMVASAVALSEAILGLNKSVHVMCPTPMLVEFNRIYKVDSIKNTIGNKDLIISLPYEKDRVEKVSYAISEDGTRFNLIISPLKGASPLTTDGVQFEYSGAQADMVFLIGVESGADLGVFYELEKQFFDACNSVVMNYSQSKFMARHQLLIGEASSFSEGVLPLIQNLSYTPIPEVATALLEGIFAESRQLTSAETTANTYEAIAVLMRAGGVRPEPPKPSIPAQNSSLGGGSVSGMSGFDPMYEGNPSGDWFPVQKTSSYVTPSQQVSTDEFATMLRSSQVAPDVNQSVPQPPSPLDSDLIETEYEDQDIEDGELLDTEEFGPQLTQKSEPAQPAVDSQFPSMEPSASTQSVPFFSAISDRVRRARKAAAAKKRRAQGGVVGTVQNPIGQVQRVSSVKSSTSQPGSHSPSKL